jgi:isoquinoline 1-oxidoreductase beta subunit
MSLIENSLIDRHSIENLTPTVSRRGLLKAGLAAGFMLAFHLPLRAGDEVEQSANNKDKFVPNAFIRIDRMGKTTLIMPQVEMGQGVYTAIPQILAEELDADYATVALAHAPPSDKLYGNPLFGIQATGNSNSIRAFWKPLRIAGAAARTMLVQAAASQWQVDPTAVRLRTALFVTQPAAAPWHMAIWRTPQGSCPCRRRRLSRIRRISC